MTRAEITKFLGELLVNTRFAGAGKHWASEVSLDPWTANGKRVKAAKRMFTAEMV